MDESKACCSQPGSMLGSQPFSKILALGYYDGPTSGILQCEACGKVLKFDLLDWDDRHDVRIFRLAEVPAESLTEAMKILPKDKRSEARLWVPMVSSLPTEEARQTVHRKIEQILAGGKPAHLLIAWENSSERVLAAKPIPGDELAKAADWFSEDDSSHHPDWFVLLGLSKNNRTDILKTRVTTSGQSVETR